MKSYLKTSFTDSKLIVDSETGEILEQDIKTVKYLANTREEFFIAYTGLIGVLRQMSNPEVRVYCYLLTNYQIGSLIPITKPLRKDIGQKEHLNERTVANTLTLLVEKKLIYRVQHGMYKINPRFAFKGSTKERDAMLKVVLEIECPDC